MSVPGFPDNRTLAERQAAHQRWIDSQYLEKGRNYTVETHKIWISGWHWYGGKKLKWEAIIRQAECPWMIVALSPDRRTRWGAEQWAREYIKRGGPAEPPRGYDD